MGHINERGEIIRDGAGEPRSPSSHSFRAESSSKVVVGAIGGYIVGSIAGLLLGIVLFAISQNAPGGNQAGFAIWGVTIWAAVTLVGSLIFIGTCREEEAEEIRDAFNENVGKMFEKLAGAVGVGFGATAGIMIVSVFLFAPLVIILVLCVGGVIIYYLGIMLGFVLCVW